MSAGWNFARRPFRDDRPVYAASALLFFVGAVLLVVNVRLYAAHRRGVADVRGEIAALETRQRSAEARANEAKAALSSYRLSTLADESRELARIVAERRFSWTGLLARLERTLPSDVGILRLQPSFGKDGEVTLDLLLAGRSREALVPTLAALAKDRDFGSVELRSESQPEGTTADPFQFQLMSRYTPVAAAETGHGGGKAPEKPAEKKKPGRSVVEKKPAAKAPAPKAPTEHRPAPRGPLNPAPPRRSPGVSP